jgi:hypothetical protein
MSNFFQSEMVRGDLQEMAEMQQFCMRSMMTFPVLSLDKQFQYFEVLETLIEKQKVFYVRLTLSDDEEAKDMVQSMKDSAVLLGAEENEDLNVMFNSLQTRVRALKKEAKSRMEQDG